MINIEVYEHFAAWLDALLENNVMPDETKAFSFNLYQDAPTETASMPYSIQLIAADRFDPEDEAGEWACYEVWSSEEDLFCLDFSDEENVDFQRVLDVFTELCKEYLEKGRSRDILLGKKGIAIGFVDGDLEYLRK